MDVEAYPTWHPNIKQAKIIEVRKEQNAMLI
jgi:hypothetical protein